MTYNLQGAATLFSNYRSALFECFPRAQQAVNKQVAKLVDCSVAGADDIWDVLWDKPIFTWRSTGGGEDMVRGAARYMAGAWKKCGLYGDFSVDRINPRLRKGKGPYDPENYRNIGRVIDVLYRLPEGSITYFVSWKIVKAGDFLRRRAAEDATPFAFLAAMTRDQATARLRKEFGKGWGPATCLHFLADLGMAYKPDQHVARAVAALELKVCKGEVPNESEALEINDILDQLLPLVYPSVTPQHRRHFDKTLMEISRERLLPHEMYKEPGKSVRSGGGSHIQFWDLRGGLQLK